MQENQRLDIYDSINGQIITLLEAGTIPWRRPWKTLGPPMNLLTRRHYTGVNFMLLSNLPYEEPYYLTFNQVKCAGGFIEKGEKGQLIVFRVEVDRKANSTSEKKKYATRYYYVYNVAQCRNIPPGLIPPPPTGNRANNPIPCCEMLVEEYEGGPVAIFHDELRAFYEPTKDYINMPPLELFESSEAYYLALFHECVHSTGHTSRLNRPEVMDGNSYGSKPYSVEELVGEIGACYLASFCNLPISKLENNVAYIQNWLDRLRNDKKFIIQASFRAQRAVDHILGVDRSGTFFEALPGEVI